MSGLGKTRAGWHVGSTTERHFGADMLQEPEDGWAIQRCANAIPHEKSECGLVRVFPKDEETGIGFFLHVPPETGIMQIRFMSYVIMEDEEEVAVVPRLWLRKKGASWRGPHALGVLRFSVGHIPTNEALSLTHKMLKIEEGDYIQFEVTRGVGSRGDSHPGDWFLHWLGVNFA